MRTSLLRRPSLIAAILALLAICAAILIATINPPHSHATTFTVTNTDDNGAGSLRDAITSANVSDGPHTIDFDIDGCPPACTINVTSTSFPNIFRDDVTIDATTQTGYVDTPIVIIDGSALGNGSGLVLTGERGSITGILSRNFPSNGIGIFGDGGSASDNIAEDNGAVGIRAAATDVTVEGNLSRRNRDGFLSSSNDGIPNGLLIGNTFTGNDDDGVVLQGDGATVTQNTITDNGDNGVQSGFSSAAPIFTANTISGNGRGGLHVTGDDALVDGNTVFDNGFEGLSIQGDRNIVTDNTVTGNGGLAGFRSGQAGIQAGYASDIVIQNNSVTGNAGDGVLVQSSAGMTVGGSGADEANTIVGNGLAGIFVAESELNGSAQPAGSIILSRDHTFSRNVIYDNGGIGIDLEPAGVTANDTLDDDTGANRRQNYPELTDATPSGSVTITGSINTRPEVPILIEFFANDECDPSGYGEGQEYIGSVQVNTNVDGDADFVTEIDSDVTLGAYISSTATHLGTNDTSEFSQCVEVTEPGAGTPTPTPTPPGTPTATPTFTPVSSPTPTPTGGAPELAHGDNDCDGDSDAVDALVSLQTTAGIDTNQQPNCPDIGVAIPAGGQPQLFGDIDCDDDVDAVDALQILRNVAGLPVNANPGCPQIGQPI